MNIESCPSLKMRAPQACTTLSANGRHRVSHGQIAKRDCEIANFAPDRTEPHDCRPRRKQTRIFRTLLCLRLPCSLIINMRLPSYFRYVIFSFVKTATSATRDGPAATKKIRQQLRTWGDLPDKNGTLHAARAQQPDSMLLVNNSQQCQLGLDCSRHNIGRLPLTPVAMATPPASSPLASDSNQPTPPVRQNFKRVVRSTAPRGRPRLITLLLQHT